MPEMTQAEWLEELTAQIQQHGIEKIAWFMVDGNSDIPAKIVEVKFNDGNIDVTLEPAYN